MRRPFAWPSDASSTANSPHRNGNRLRRGLKKVKRGVFLESKEDPERSAQPFFRSIFRLITISLRLSREVTLRTGDFAPSNSA
jgi:hypothetical protein